MMRKVKQVEATCCTPQHNAVYKDAEGNRMAVQIGPAVEIVKADLKPLENSSLKPQGPGVGTPQLLEKANKGKKNA